MKNNRFFARLNFSSIAVPTCVGMAIINLIFMLIIVIVGKIDGWDLSSQIYEIVSFAISVIYYMFLTSIFMKAKNNFGYAYQGMLSLVLCNVVIPLIFNLLPMIMGSLDNPLSLLISLWSYAAGIAYFVFLLLDARMGRYKKWMSTLLLVFGCIYAAGSLFLFIMNCVIIFPEVFDASIEWSSKLVNLFLLIVSGFSFLEASLFIFYPLFLKKERKYN